MRIRFFSFLVILAAAVAVQGTETISGTVTDSVTGAPLKAVAVTAPGDSTPVYTDAMGVFTLQAVTGIRRSAPVALDMSRAEPVRILSAEGHVVAAGPGVSFRGLPDGMYMAELMCDGIRYLAPAVMAGGTVLSGGTGTPVASYRGKTSAVSGTAMLSLGKSGYRFKEQQADGGTMDLSVVMSPLPDSAYPRTAAEVGPTDPTVLDSCGTITVTQSNQIIENVDIHGIIHIKDSVDNILIRNFRITSPGYWGIFVRNNNCSNIVVEDGEICGLNEMGDGMNGQNYTVRRVYVHHMGGDSFKAGANNDIEQCYITAIGQAPGAHGDGVQMMNNGGIRIKWNNFQTVTGTVNACVFPGGGGFIPDVLVEGNRFNGGGYTVRGNEDMTVRNNVFGRDYVYGIRTGEYLEWSGNVWEDSGEAAP